MCYLSRIARSVRTGVCKPEEGREPETTTPVGTASFPKVHIHTSDYNPPPWPKHQTPAYQPFLGQFCSQDAPTIYVTTTQIYRSYRKPLSPSVACCTMKRKPHHNDVALTRPIGSLNEKHPTPLADDRKETTGRCWSLIERQTSLNRNTLLLMLLEA